MVLEEQFTQNSYQYGSNESIEYDLNGADERKSDNNQAASSGSKMMINEKSQARSFKMPYQQSFEQTDWSQLAEATLPLKTSRYLTRECAAQRRISSPYNLMTGFITTNASHYGGLRGPLNSTPPTHTPFASNSLEHYYTTKSAIRLSLGDGGGGGDAANGRDGSNLLHASSESRSKLELSRRLITVNLISLLINLLLALVAFYFSFVNNSSSTTAFAADCVLDFISSAIVLWRYHGDLSDVYMHAREQIACIYLGALFEISALGIIIKASSDIASGVDLCEPAPGYDLIYLAAVATIACSILIVFKWSLYTTLRDKSILLDVINTFISTIFAITLCLMTVLSNADSSFWYFDPILSIILALFMAGFGLKVIHQNFHVLRPSYHDDDDSPLGGSPFAKLSLLNRDNERMGLVGGERKRSGGAGCGQYETNLNTSLDYSRANWQKTDYSSIEFV